MHPDPIRREDDVFRERCIWRRPLAGLMSHDRHLGVDRHTPLFGVGGVSGNGLTPQSIHRMSVSSPAPPPHPFQGRAMFQMNTLRPSETTTTIKTVTYVAGLNRHLCLRLHRKKRLGWGFIDNPISMVVQTQ
jgi:hypothetical protein